MSCLGEKERFIVQRIQADYHAKAKGHIVATSKVNDEALRELRLSKSKGIVPMTVEIHQGTGKKRLADIKVDFYVDCTQ